MGRHLATIATILFMIGMRPVAADFAIAGPGAQSCSVVNANATPGRDSSQNLTTILIFTWAQGYISGLNGAVMNLSPGKRSAWDLERISTEQQWDYIVAYCNANPSAMIVTAVTSLAAERLFKR
jgi:hypothetical protein